MTAEDKAREILEYICDADRRNANPHKKDITNVMTAKQAMGVYDIAARGGF